MVENHANFVVDIIVWLSTIFGFLVCSTTKIMYTLYIQQVIDESDYMAMDIKPHFHVKSLTCLSINHIHKACISTHKFTQTNPPPHIHKTIPFYAVACISLFCAMAEAG